jgi:hypothetical protein
MLKNFVGMASTPEKALISVPTILHKAQGHNRSACVPGYQRLLPAVAGSGCNDSAERVAAHRAIEREANLGTAIASLQRLTFEICTKIQEEGGCHDNDIN